MSYSSLTAYYKTTFAMVQHHKWNIEAFENLIPYERDIYVDLLAAHMKEQAEQQRNR